MLAKRFSFIIYAFIFFGFGAAAHADHRIHPRGLFEFFLPRKTIDPSIMGVSAFVNDSRFGSIRTQLHEVKNTIKLKHIRVLFNWNDDVQPSPDAAIDFSFYDNIVRNIPRRVDALVILNGLPSWMEDESNWINGNPRETFVELWVKRVIARYGKKRRISGFQIWNEPNTSGNDENILLDIDTKADNYVELLASAYSVIKDQAPKKKVVGAATTSILQDFPETVNYNEAMKTAGAESFLDVWAVHFYGKQIENFIRSGGAEDFLNSLSRPIWVTESGVKGVNEQREYVERLWPYLKTQVPAISRFYYYQFTEASAADNTYGLKNLTPGFTISDLYIYLRDRRK